jgi:hypothetical protein
VLSDAAFLVEGHHAIEVRSRMVGDYRTLDPDPVRLDVVIDSDPPVIHAELTPDGAGATVEAQDLVSGDRIGFELLIDGERRPVSLDSHHFVSIPELRDPSRSIAIGAIDEAGLEATVVLRQGETLAARTPQASAGCVCARADTQKERALGSALGLLAMLGLVRRGRKKI